LGDPLLERLPRPAEHAPEADGLWDAPRVHQATDRPAGTGKHRGNVVDREHDRAGRAGPGEGAGLLVRHRYSPFSLGEYIRQRLSIAAFRHLLHLQSPRFCRARPGGRREPGPLHARTPVKPQAQCFDGLTSKYRNPTVFLRWCLTCRRRRVDWVLGFCWRAGPPGWAAVLRFECGVRGTHDGG